MVVLSVYATLFVFFLIALATSFCIFVHCKYKHKATFWLALYTAGLGCFVLSQLGKLIMDLETESALLPGPMYLLWSSFGSVILVIAFSHFLLHVFGATPRPGVRILSLMGTATITVLSLTCLITGWSDVSKMSAEAEALRRGFLLVFAAVCILCVLIFHSRLADRTLYKTFLAQLGFHLVLLPLIIAEAVGFVRIAAFPNFGALQPRIGSPMGSSSLASLSCLPWGAAIHWSPRARPSQFKQTLGVARSMHARPT